jgi:hypothetical protein
MHVILKGDTKPKKINPKLGKRLVDLKLATYETREVVPEISVVDAVPVVEVKPKRQYRRRDMKAE